VHERTQRAIARLLFVFCCALPTLITMLCVLVTWTPWYDHRVLRKLESDISRATGMIVRIDDFHRSAPSSIRLSDVRVVNPETLREVARVREVEWVRRDNEVSIFLRQPELQSSQLESAWKLAHDRFLCDPDRTNLPVRFAANDLTIQSRSGAMTLRDVDAWLKPNRKSIEAAIQCVPANDDSSSAVMVRVSRDRSVEPPSTRWLLDTGTAALPCSALAGYLPILGSLGSEAEFSGKMRWQSDSKNSMVDLGGSQFRNVALDRLFEDLPHRLSGLATIQFNHCHINPRDGRRDIVGSIRAKNGQIGRSLLRSARRNLGFQDTVLEGVGDVPFDLIAVGFNIDNTRLSLDGICGTEPGQENIGAGVVMCTDGFPVVQSSEQELHAVDAITLIAPDHAVPVPMSGQTGWLMNVLIPPSRSLRGSENRIRSARAWEGGSTIKQSEASTRY
jgi:hypothetical protein